MSTIPGLAASQNYSELCVICSAIRLAKNDLGYSVKFGWSSPLGAITSLCYLDNGTFNNRREYLVDEPISLLCLYQAAKLWHVKIVHLCINLVTNKDCEHYSYKVDHIQVSLRYIWQKTSDGDLIDLTEYGKLDQLTHDLQMYDRLHKAIHTIIWISCRLTEQNIILNQVSFMDIIFYT